MINVFFYSIAGKKTNDKIDGLIDALISDEYTPTEDKRILKFCQKVAREGNYPEKDYFTSFYAAPEFTYKSIAEISTYVKDVRDFNQQQYLQKQVMSAINESNTSKDILDKLAKLTADAPQESDDDLDVGPKLYSESLSRPTTEGILFGVPEIDEKTMGIQYGTIASICAFTGHGKSTLLNSVIYKNAAAGKKIVLLSLELAPELVWNMYEARYMSQVKGLPVTAQDLIYHKLPSDVQDKVLAAEPEFISEVADNIIIVDENKLSKQMMLDYHKFSKFIQQVISKKGWSTLDLLGLDHVHQLELLYPECGNMIIKQIQSFAKTFTDGVHNPAVAMCVQCNREGEKRARKRDGLYDLQAIGDLNEVERSSTLAVFLYTSDDDKISQETKITLVKNRLGAPITTPITATFNPSIITVGESVEQVTLSEDDFNNFGGDLGGGFDDF